MRRSTQRRPMYLSEPGVSPTRTGVHVATEIEYDLRFDGQWCVVPVRDVIVFRECGHPARRVGRCRCFDCKGTEGGR